MIEQKQAQLKKYYEITMAILNCFIQGQEDRIASLLEAREHCITDINKLDEAAGKVLMNEEIQQQLGELMKLEPVIRSHMEQSMKRLSDRVRFVQNEQYLSKQYEEPMTVSKGIFYDRSK